VYDRLNKWGGAERVLLSLRELFPDAPLYTSVYHAKRASWAKEFVVKSSFLQRFPYAASSHEPYAIFMPLAFESFSFDRYDLVISVTSESAKGIITKPNTIHICYCLTPTRYLWSGYDEYFTSSAVRFLSKPAVSYLRAWDKIAAQRPDAYIAISKEVQKRIKKYYERESTVIYPPVAIDGRRWNREDSNLKIEDRVSKGYFLIVSRFVPYKKIDIAIKACSRLKLPLKIVGSGAQEGYLRSLAGPTVEFLGNLTDKELLSYYKNSWALLFPGHEDFGIVIVEALASGTPVIAFKNGGALEIIKEGKTGAFFYPQTVESLESVLQSFSPVDYQADECRKSVMQFEKKRFLKEFRQAVEALFLAHKKKKMI